MKRIIHILSAIDGGGGERVVYNYYKFMNHYAVKLDLAVIDKGRKQLLEDDFMKMGCRIYYVPAPILKRLWAIHLLMRKNHYDGVHCHRIFLAEIYMILGWINRIPLRIAHAHMAFVVGHTKGVILNNLMKPLLKLFTTKRMACGKAAGRYVWGSLNKVTILNNAIDIDSFKMDNKTRLYYRERLKLSDDDIVIGHVGRFNEQKNHAFLIDIFEHLCLIHPESSFHLIMIGEGELLDNIQAKVRNSAYASKCHFLGLQPDVNKWMQSFDVFVLPSLFEGLPVVGIEAQATGLPCVFSDSITSEFKMSKRARFISLQATKDEWCNAIYEFGNEHAFDDNKDVISEHGFNIIQEASKLEKIYINGK